MSNADEQMSGVVSPPAKEMDRSGVFVSVPPNPISAASSASRLSVSAPGCGCASAGAVKCTRDTKSGETHGKRVSETLKQSEILKVHTPSPAAPKSQAGSPSLQVSVFGGCSTLTPSGGAA